MKTQPSPSQGAEPRGRPQHWVKHPAGLSIHFWAPQRQIQGLCTTENCLLTTGTPPAGKLRQLQQAQNIRLLSCATHRPTRSTAQQAQRLFIDSSSRARCCSAIFKVTCAALVSPLPLPLALLPCKLLGADHHTAQPSAHLRLLLFIPRPSPCPGPQMAPDKCLS